VQARVEGGPFPFSSFRAPVRPTKFRSSFSKIIHQMTLLPFSLPPVFPASLRHGLFCSHIFFSPPLLFGPTKSTDRSSAFSFPEHLFPSTRHGHRFFFFFFFFFSRGPLPSPPKPQRPPQPTISGDHRVRSPPSSPPLPSKHGRFQLTAKFDKRIYTAFSPPSPPFLERSMFMVACKGLFFSFFLPLWKLGLGPMLRAFSFFWWMLLLDDVRLLDGHAEMLACSGWEVFVEVGGESPLLFFLRGCPKRNGFSFDGDSPCPSCAKAWLALFPLFFSLLFFFFSPMLKRPCPSFWLERCTGRGPGRSSLGLPFFLPFSKTEIFGVSPSLPPNVGEATFLKPPLQTAGSFLFFSLCWQPSK